MVTVVVVRKVVTVLIRRDSSVILEFNTMSDTGVIDNMGLEQESCSLESVRAHTLCSGSMVIEMATADCSPDAAIQPIMAPITEMDPIVVHDLRGRIIKATKGAIEHIFFHLKQDSKVFITITDFLRVRRVKVGVRGTACDRGNKHQVAALRIDQILRQIVDPSGHIQG